MEFLADWGFLEWAAFIAVTALVLDVLLVRRMRKERTLARRLLVYDDGPPPDKPAPTLSEGHIVLPVTYAPGDIRSVEFRDYADGVTRSPQERVKNAFAKGRQCLLQGDYDQARVWLEKAAELETFPISLATIYLNLGNVYLVLNEKLHAEDAFEKSEELATQARNDDCIQAAQQNGVVLMGI